VSIFITGTDTGVGKTYTALHLLRLLRASGRKCAAMKPICCGDRRDAELLLAAGGEGFTIDEINPLWLKTPAAPLVGSFLERVAVDVQRILVAYHSLRRRVDFLIVEGVGGWLVPITEDFFVSDLAAAMDLPVLVVAANRLGCLNHSALTVRSIQERNLRCLGLALNSFEPAAASKDIAALTNADILKKILNVPVIDGLRDNLSALPADWQFLIEQAAKPGVSNLQQCCKENKQG
jgi:dethiobiotin synthetase